MGIYSNYITESTLPINEGLFKSKEYKSRKDLAIKIKNIVADNIDLKINNSLSLGKAFDPNKDFYNGETNELTLLLVGKLTFTTVSWSVEDIKKSINDSKNEIKRVINDELGINVLDIKYVSNADTKIVKNKYHGIKITLEE